MEIIITEFEKETWFKIGNHDLLRPFFMNVVSDSNHWLFISSNGGLSAGRKNAEYALFPYYTEDKLTSLANTTGSKTILQVAGNNGVHVWEPFSESYVNKYKTSKNLYKNAYGNKVMFEEKNHDLGLTFRYQWNTSHRFGFVRKAELINTSGNKYGITVLDGIQNIMPYGIESAMQMAASNLADAYKRSELISETGLAIFALSAIIVDKAEPSEALKANIAWSLGLESPKYLLSSLQLSRFRKKQTITEEYDIKGEKGAYFVHADIQLPAESSKKWMIVANVNQNHSQVIGCHELLKKKEDLEKKVQQDIDKGTRNLLRLIAGADGLQLTADQKKDARHYSNVLFNIMRGGIFHDNYQIEKGDFTAYLAKANKEMFRRNRKFIDTLQDHFDISELYRILETHDDPDLIRLSKEYLPLKFSRRHGDPSRPWNKFSINTHDDVNGNGTLDYEGNWRDIFQNWEALLHSYPGFVEGMIFKFLNATTFDGYNPYRVTKGGFDWETIEPGNPWSYIGYWGDHQIIYLLKFLEFYHTYKPEALSSLFTSELFTYANIPYRIKSYREISKDPKNTIDFDKKVDRAIRWKMIEKGADGALLGNRSSEIHHVNFLEKTLAMVLAKVSNFIPEGGIWLNTQRPEWNDANNALVGNGVSMVTLYYLRRFFKFFEKIIAQSDLKKITVSEELRHYFIQIAQILHENRHLLSGSINDTNRKQVTDALGQAGSDYRNLIYDGGFSGEKSNLELDRISRFIDTTLVYLEHSINANRRPDHLYHAYNLMSITESGITLSHLSEMLEGQVAAISSGYLDPESVLKVLDALRNSALYRKDQNSYLLYPDKDLPRFLEKNNIPGKSVGKSRLLQKLIRDKDPRIIEQDINGGYHFNGNFRNADDLKAALEEMKSNEYYSLVKEESATILQIFEEVFNHKAFTGRSGTFFAYEGLGSIYWHMVSKLYLAVWEACNEAHSSSQNPDIIKRLAGHFHEIGEGIGIHKSPDEYGAFPTDPYSHTPKHRGAQQPGMTGQVKEDILVRMGELGVSLHHGSLCFRPFLLCKEEFMNQAKNFEYITVHQDFRQLEVPENAICFTICQTPVICKIAPLDELEVVDHNGQIKKIDGHCLDEKTTGQVLQRTGEISHITVSLRKKHLMERPIPSKTDRPKTNAMNP